MKIVYDKKYLEAMKRRQELDQILHTFHGWSTRKISQMEGISHQAVAKSINLALKKLRKFFAAQG